MQIRKEPINKAFGKNQHHIFVLILLNPSPFRVIKAEILKIPFSGD